MTTALEGGEGSASRPGRSLPPGKSRYPLYSRLGGPQGRSWQVRKVSPPTGIRSPDRLARSQSLYRLCYPAHSRVSGVTVLSVSLGECQYNAVNRPFLLASASRHFFTLFSLSWALWIKVVCLLYYVKYITRNLFRMVLTVISRLGYKAI